MRSLLAVLIPAVSKHLAVSLVVTLAVSLAVLDVGSTYDRPIEMFVCISARRVRCTIALRFVGFVGTPGRIFIRFPYVNWWCSQTIEDSDGCVSYPGYKRGSYKKENELQDAPLKDFQIESFNFFGHSQSHDRTHDETRCCWVFINKRWKAGWCFKEFQCSDRVLQSLKRERETDSQRKQISKRPRFSLAGRIVVASLVDHLVQKQISFNDFLFKKRFSSYEGYNRKCTKFAKLVIQSGYNVTCSYQAAAFRPPSDWTKRADQSKRQTRQWRSNFSLVNLPPSNTALRCRFTAPS